MAEGTTYQPLGFVRKDPNWFYILTKFRGSSSQFGADNFYSSFLASYAVKMSQNRIGQRTPLNFYDHDFHLCWDWDKAESPIGWRLPMLPNPADGSSQGQELKNLSNGDFEEIFDSKNNLLLLPESRPVGTWRLTEEGRHRAPWTWGGKLKEKERFYILIEAYILALDYILSIRW